MAAAYDFLCMTLSWYVKDEPSQFFVSPHYLHEDAAVLIFFQYMIVWNAYSHVGYSCNKVAGICGADDWSICDQHVFQC